jgi:hypothetical protein
MNEQRSHTASASPDVRPGDIWQEVDPRHPRFVRVTRVLDDDVSIYAVEWDQVAGDWIIALNPRTKRPAPERWAQLKRFNGKRTGYALHHRTDALVPAPAQTPYGHSMLPNDSHPGPGCSCADCLRAHP